MHKLAEALNPANSPGGDVARCVMSQLDRGDSPATAQGTAVILPRNT
jgi:hypothetical protein